MKNIYCVQSVILKNTYKFRGDDTLCFINKESHVPRTIITCRTNESESVKRRNKKKHWHNNTKSDNSFVFASHRRNKKKNKTEKIHFYAIANAYITHILAITIDPTGIKVATKQRVAMQMISKRIHTFALEKRRDEKEGERVENKKQRSCS